MSKRDAILDAAEALLWERGYESTSPSAILKASGAGQGSLYHHFSGKKAVGIAAMERHEDILWSAAAAHLDAPSNRNAVEAIVAWLQAERDALAGCRLGRLVVERSIRTDAELRAPIERYFARLVGAIRARLDEALPAKATSDREGLASLLVSVVQGGYILSMGTGDPKHLERATRSAERLLRAELER